MSTQTLVDKIDGGLAVHYKKHKLIYYTKRSDGSEIGKFKHFITENGLDDDAQIKEELEAGVDGCTLLDFDNQFPLDSSIDKKQQPEEIYKILRDLAGYKTIPKYTLDVSMDVTENEMKEVGEKYFKQMKLKTDKDKVLRYFLAVGSKKGFPFLTYMIDTYTNDNAEYYTKSGKCMTIDEWSQKNKFMQLLKKKNAMKVKELTQAMKNYNTRIMPRLKYKTTAKVKDFLEPIVEYIVSTAVFLQKLMNNLQGGTPFQVDLMFAVNDVYDMVEKKEKIFSDQDEDDDVKEDNKPIEKNIGNVRKKLKQYPLHFSVSHNETKKTETEEKEKTIESITRLLTDTCKDFQTTLSESKDENYNYETYPQRRRFSIFVDRRNRNDCDNLQELEGQLTFFQPPDGCNKMETNHVPEIGFGFVGECLIPKLKHETEHIAGKDHLHGGLMTFIFCVEQVDEIRCYIIWNGQTMRFEGRHIRSILPILFMDWEDNINFINGDKVKDMENIFENNIRDRIFDPFYREAAMKKQKT